MRAVLYFARSRDLRNDSTIILGAGPAGLAAGYYITLAGQSALLLEAAAEAGGFARTFTDGEFRYDSGAHRFHDKDAGITEDMQELMGAELLEVHAPSQIFWENRFLNFPLSPGNLVRRMGPVNLTRATVDLATARLSARATTPDNFAQNAYHRYGKTIADAFLIGYSEKLWGIEAARLMPEVSGGRLKGLSASTMLVELVRGQRGKTRHLDGSFFYPRGGYGRIADRLAEVIGPENILTNSRITKIRHDGRRITAVEINGRESFTPECVISTLPPVQMLKLLDPAPPAPLIELAGQLKFRDLLLIALFLDRPRVSANASIYFPARDIPFTRLYEPKNRSHAMAPPDRTCVVVEIPCFAGDEQWRRDDQDLRDLVAAHLHLANLISPRDVLGGRIHRLRAAYPVLEVGVESIVRETQTYLNGLCNLHVVGRAGRFEYTHVHDLLRQGKELAQRIRAPVEAAGIA